MATCADCVHVEVCMKYVADLSAANGVLIDDPKRLEECLNADGCEFFKDRSRFVQIPYQTGVGMTPEAAIIRLNSIRTDTDERDPAIDMAIKAINCCMVKRKPIDTLEGEIECPACGMSIDEFDSERYCFNCGQALDWS